MATIGFENISVSVQEGAGFAVLYVAVLNGALGRDVTVRFSTADLSATGELCYCSGIVGFVANWQNFFSVHGQIPLSP